MLASGTLEDLRRAVVPDDGRVKFMLKVLHVLNYSRSHPLALLTLGAGWCPDGIHFVVNSTILGEFLALRSNTINTNFRDHGFEIVPCTAEHLKSDFGLTDTRHWKKRKNANFTIATTVADAAQIRCGLDRVPSSDFSESLRKLIRDDPGQLLELQKLRFGLERDEQWFIRLFDFLTDFWRRIAHGCVSASFADIASELGTVTETHRANLAFLLDLHTDNSQVSDDVFFATFARFFVRYGFDKDAGAVVRALSADFLGYDSSPRFKHWFKPNQEKTAASAAIALRGPNSWCVIPARNPGRFTLLFQATDRQVALRIVHDAIAESPQEQFAVKFEDGSWAYQPSLEEILTQTLRLTINYEDAEPMPKTPEYVGAGAILENADRARAAPPPPPPPPPLDSQSDVVLPTFLDVDSQFTLSQIDFPFGDS
jgi:hypothetical protein